MELSIRHLSLRNRSAIDLLNFSVQPDLLKFLNILKIIDWNIIAIQ